MIRLIILTAALGLPLALGGCGGERPVSPVSTDTPTEPHVADRAHADDVITSISLLIDTPNAHEMDGREVRLMNVRVVEVLSDTAMYVADATPIAGDMDPTMQTTADAGNRVLVARGQGLRETLTGRDTLDQNLRDGLMVDIEGTARVWTQDVDADPPSALTDGSLYIEASTIDRYDPARMDVDPDGTGMPLPGARNGAVSNDG